MTVEFKPFPKIPRLSREIVVTEKLDGTNAAVQVQHDFTPDDPFSAVVLTEVGPCAIFAQSRNRFVTPGNDNYGFAAWVAEHASELVCLGPGVHYGEWWGTGIQRNYGLTERRFSLFNVGRWGEDRPPCCHVVPVLHQGAFSEAKINGAMTALGLGSVAAPGFMNPEGIIVFHTASGQLFKRTFEGDDLGKGIASRQFRPPEAVNG